MNVMQKAHQYARSHRHEYTSYREALSEGLRVAHREVKAAREGGAQEHPALEEPVPTKEKILYQAREVPADKAAQIMAQGVEKYRNQIRPFLLRDWKADDYNGREVFRRGIWR
jgi:hypothetical protein